MVVVRRLVEARVFKSNVGHHYAYGLWPLLTTTTATTVTTTAAVLLLANIVSASLLNEV